MACHVTKQDKVDVQTWDYAYPRYGYWHDTDVSVTQYTQGTLVIDFVDASSKEVYWRGWATGTLTEESRPTASIEGVVTKGFGKRKLYETAQTAMGRRGLKWTPAQEQMWDEIFQLTAEPRNEAIKKGRRALRTVHG